MPVAPPVPGVEAGCLDRQLAGGAVSSDCQGPVVCTEDAANRPQSPHVLDGEADLTVLRVDAPQSVREPGLGYVHGIGFEGRPASSHFPDSALPRRRHLSQARVINTRLSCSRETPLAAR